MRTAGLALAAVLAFVLADSDARAAFPGNDGRIAYECQLEGRSEGLCTQDADGTDVRLVAERLGRPAWSPDGRLLAASLATGHGRGIFVLAADGSGLRRITANDDSGGSEPSWSPDGTRLVYTALGRLYVIDADGANRRQLTSPLQPSDPREQVVDIAPVWSPTGDRIAFTRERRRSECGGDFCSNFPTGASVRTIRPDGTADVSVIEDADQPDWAPDGQRLVVVAGASTRPFMPRITTVDADGSDVRDLGLDGTDPAFAPSGDRLVFYRGPLFVADLLGGSPLEICPGRAADWQPLPPAVQAPPSASRDCAVSTPSPPAQPLDPAQPEPPGPAQPERGSIARLVTHARARCRRSRCLLRIRGRLLRPTAAGRRVRCAGRVWIAVFAHGRRVTAVRARVAPDCRYRKLKRFRVRRRTTRAFALRSRFEGSDLLRPKRGGRVRIRTHPLR